MFDPALGSFGVDFSQGDEVVTAQGSSYGAAGINLLDSTPGTNCRVRYIQEDDSNSVIYGVSGSPLISSAFLGASGDSVGLYNGITGGAPAGAIYQNGAPVFIGPLIQPGSVVDVIVTNNPNGTRFIRYRVDNADFGPVIALDSAADCILAVSIRDNLSTSIDSIQKGIVLNDTPTGRVFGPFESARRNNLLFLIDDIGLDGASDTSDDIRNSEGDFVIGTGDDADCVDFVVTDDVAADAATVFISYFTHQTVPTGTPNNAPLTNADGSNVLWGDLTPGETVRLGFNGSRWFIKEDQTGTEMKLTPVNGSGVIVNNCFDATNATSRTTAASEVVPAGEIQTCCFIVPAINIGSTFIGVAGANVGFGVSAVGLVQQSSSLRDNGQILLNGAVPGIIPANTLQVGSEVCVTIDRSSAQSVVTYEVDGVAVWSGSIGTTNDLRFAITSQGQEVCYSAQEQPLGKLRTLSAGGTIVGDCFQPEASSSRMSAIGEAVPNGEVSKCVFNVETPSAVIFIGVVNPNDNLGNVPVGTLPNSIGLRLNGQILRNGITFSSNQAIAAGDEICIFIDRTGSTNIVYYEINGVEFSRDELPDGDLAFAVTSSNGVEVCVEAVAQPHQQVLEHHSGPGTVVGGCLVADNSLARTTAAITDPVPVGEIQKCCFIQPDSIGSGVTFIGVFPATQNVGGSAIGLLSGSIGLRDNAQIMRNSSAIAVLPNGSLSAGDIVCVTIDNTNGAGVVTFEINGEVAWTGSASPAQDNLRFGVTTSNGNVACLEGSPMPVMFGPDSTEFCATPEVPTTQVMIPPVSGASENNNCLTLLPDDTAGGVFIASKDADAASIASNPTQSPLIWHWNLATGDIVNNGTTLGNVPYEGQDAILCVGRSVNDQLILTLGGFSISADQDFSNHDFCFYVEDHEGGSACFEYVEHSFGVDDPPLDVERLFCDVDSFEGETNFTIGEDNQIIFRPLNQFGDPYTPDVTFAIQSLDGLDSCGEVSAVRNGETWVLTITDAPAPISGTCQIAAFGANNLGVCSVPISFEEAVEQLVCDVNSFEGETNFIIGENHEIIFRPLNQFGDPYTPDVTFAIQSLDGTDACGGISAVRDGDIWRLTITDAPAPISGTCQIAAFGGNNIGVCSVPISFEVAPEVLVCDIDSFEGETNFTIGEDHEIIFRPLNQFGDPYTPDVTFAIQSLDGTDACGSVSAVRNGEVWVLTVTDPAEPISGTCQIAAFGANNIGVCSVPIAFMAARPQLNCERSSFVGNKEIDPSASNNRVSFFPRNDMLEFVPGVTFSMEGEGCGTVTSSIAPGTEEHIIQFNQSPTADIDGCRLVATAPDGSMCVCVLAFVGPELNCDESVWSRPPS